MAEKVLEDMARAAAPTALPAEPRPLAALPNAPGVASLPAGSSHGTESVPPLVSLCGKMDVLDRLLLRLRTRGHKVGHVLRKRGKEKRVLRKEGGA